MAEAPLKVGDLNDMVRTDPYHPFTILGNVEEFHFVGFSHSAS